MSNLSTITEAPHFGTTLADNLTSLLIPMKNLLFLAIGSMLLLSSCRYSECSEPVVGLRFMVDSTDTLRFQFDTYEKGSKFSRLVSSEGDSAYIDTLDYITHKQASTFARQHNHVDDKYDYIISVPASGKTYKISDINHSGKRKVKADGIISENRTACTRTVNYTVNGQAFSVEGSTYEIGWSMPKEGAFITITK